MLGSLRSHPAVAQVSAGKWQTVRLTSTYYDTPRHDLAAAGVALRVRRDGRRWWQTAKGGGSAAAGLHSRVEHEWPPKGPRPDRAQRPPTASRQPFGAAPGIK